MSRDEVGILRIKPLIKKMMFVNVVHAIVGLDEQNISPRSTPIILIFPRSVITKQGKIRTLCSDEEEDIVREVNFFQLFRTYPPFEPLFVESLYNDVKIIGDYVWFIRPSEILRNGIPTSEKHSIFSYDKLIKQFASLAKICNVECQDILCGKYVDLGNYMIIQKIVVPRSISDGYRKWYKILDLGDVRIIYGFYFAHRHLQSIAPYQLNESILNRLQRMLEEEKKSRYRIDTLNYVSWCHGGTELCTDAFSVGEECTGCRNARKTYICKDFPGYGKYSYTRKIAPKVFSEFQNVIMPHYISELRTHYEVPLLVFITRRIMVHSVVESFSMYLPSFGGFLLIKPNKKPISPLMRTNGILIMFHEDLVRAFIDTIALNTSRYQCRIGTNRFVNLLDLLLTKFVLYNALKNGQLRVDLDENNKLRIRIESTHSRLKDLDEFLCREKNNIVNSLDFMFFVGKVLTHTLAHMLINKVASTIKLDLEDLLYVYGCEERMKGMCYVGVFESNDYGAINIDIELKKILKTHKDDTINIYVTRIEKVRLNSFSKMLREALKEIDNIYMNILKLVEESRDDALESLRNSAYVVCSEVSSKCQNICQKYIDSIVNELILFFEKNLGSLVSKGIILDQSIITQFVETLISSHLSKLAKYIQSRLISRVKVKSHELQCIEDILERLFDKYLTELVTIIEPNYCLDGCNADIHLERYCTEALFENLTTSRCALRYFLAFIGIDLDLIKELEKFKVKGDILQRIISIANRNVYIQTTYISKEGIDALVNLLSKGVNVVLELDKRIKERSEKYVRDLEELKHRYPEKFNYKFTNVPDHDKSLKVDNLVIYTSWNYGTSIEPLQGYIAFVSDDKERIPHRDKGENSANSRQ